MTFESLGGYARVSREIEARMEADAVERWTKKRPADARGATPPSSGLGHDPVPSDPRPGGRTQPEYNPDHHRSLIGQAETDYDRLQREVGLAKLDNEVLRDLLEHAWGTLGLLEDGRNQFVEALRARIWAHLHDEEASCPTCDHYVVNHGAAGPCAVEGCECQGNDDATRTDMNGTPSA